MEGATIPGRSRLGSKNRTINRNVISLCEEKSLARLHRRGIKLMNNQRLYIIIAVMSLVVTSLLLSSATTTPTKQESHNKPDKRNTISGTKLFNLTYYSEWNATPSIVYSDSHIVGDMIILNATWISGDAVNQTRITVNATAVPFWISAENNTHSVTINTRGLGANHTCAINMTAWLVNGSILSERIHDVFLGNFFEPHLEVITPNGGEIWSGVNNITWSAWDNNSLEELTFEVLLSSDGGKSFMLLATDIENTWYPWNSTGFLLQSNYQIEVRVTDGIYTVFDRSDDFFTAGDLIISSTTTTTTSSTQPTETTTTTSHITSTSTSATTTITGTSSTTSSFVTTSPTPTFTNTYPTGVLAIVLASAIIGSAVLAVVVYYFAGRRM
jgi:hypothetical protein